MTPAFEEIDEQIITLTRIRNDCIVHLYTKNRVALEGISEQCGLSLGTIARILRAEGVTVGGKGRRKKNAV